MPGTQSGLTGRKLVDYHGDKVGSIDRVFEHRDTQWAVVKRGILGVSGVTLVPLDTTRDEDGDVWVPYECDHIGDAPSVELDGDQLTDEQADQLHRHYGLEAVTGLAAEGDEDDIELRRETRDAHPPGMNDGPDSPFVKRRRERAEELGVPNQE